MIHTIQSVIPNSDHTLTLTFAHGEKKIFDMRPYLNIGIFQELKKEEMFRDIRVNFGTVEWKNGADFDPEILYEKSISVKNGS